MTRVRAWDGRGARRRRRVVAADETARVATSTLTTPGASTGRARRPPSGTTASTFGWGRCVAAPRRARRDRGIRGVGTTGTGTLDADADWDVVPGLGPVGPAGWASGWGRCVAAGSGTRLDAPASARPRTTPANTHDTGTVVGSRSAWPRRPRARVVRTSRGEGRGPGGSRARARRVDGRVLPARHLRHRGGDDGRVHLEARRNARRREERLGRVSRNPRITTRTFFDTHSRKDARARRRGRQGSGRAVRCVTYQKVFGLLFKGEGSVFKRKF